MNNRKLINGIILITIGIFLFLVNLGYISFSILFGIFDLWPLIFIVVGVNILFKKKSITFITWTLFFVILIVYGVFYQDGIVNKELVRNNINVEKPIETTYGEFDLDIGAAKVNIDSEEEGLIRANLEGRELLYNETYKNNKETANLKFEGKTYSIINLDKSKGSNYNFNLNKDVIWDLDLDLGAISGKLNLEEIPIKSIDLDFGAGDLDMILGNKYNHSNIKIDSGASNLTILIPKEAGIKLKLDAALTKTNIDDLNLNKSGDYYISSNYEEANTKLEFDIDMGAGKIDFKMK
jgi:Domain of unknown function (DUF5668)